MEDKIKLAEDFLVKEKEYIKEISNYKYRVIPNLYRQIRALKSELIEEKLKKERNK